MLTNTARLTVDLNAIRHNLSVAQRCAPQSKVMAMVKANAYGHGLLDVAFALDQADGLAVARLSEALALREAGITAPVLLLGTLLDNESLRFCAEKQIDVVAHDEYSVALIAQSAPPQPLRVWLKLDTGMHRQGVAPGAFRHSQQLLAQAGHVQSLVYFTHFSSAEQLNRPTTAEQMALFNQTVGELKPVSLANSAALIAHPASRGDWVRPGIMLYGDNPFGPAHPVALRPTMYLSADVLAVRDVPQGDTVGYHGIWRADRPSRVATLGVGYGDGYPRHAGNGTPVWLNGQRVPLVGRVSMDNITVDVTDLPHVGVGDTAELWGQHILAREVAEAAGTISYALFTGVTSRVSRRVLGKRH